MAIYLVRHAKAGSRPSWQQPDDLRPLTEAGRVQALAITDHLLRRDVGTILTSRYVRCVQTVQPLADKLDLQVELSAPLAEEAPITRAWALLEKRAKSDRDTVMCSHGNILGGLLDRLRRHGIELIGDEISCRKGSVWTVNVDSGVMTDAVLTIAQA